MARWLVEQKNGEFFSLPTTIVEPKHVRHLSPLAWKILQSLIEEPSYPKRLGKKLKEHEQKIYYHIRNLEKAKLIHVIKEEDVHGVTAKYYGVKNPCVSLKLKELESTHKLFGLKKEYENFLHPFIDNGKLNALFVLGSIEPHGITKARARDLSCGINVALFFGSFLNHIPNPMVKIDTEITQHELNNNLILIGGPGVNKVVADVNNKLPIRFKKEKNFYHSIYSSISKKYYTEENQGIIVKTRNPFNHNKYILVIAGRRYKGTETDVFSFLYHFDAVCIGNKYNPKIYAKVVEGFDTSADNKSDIIEIKE